MKFWKGLFLVGLLFTACEDNSPEAPLVYAPEQIERLLLTNGESTNWVLEDSPAGSCTAYEELLIQPIDTLDQVLLLQTYTTTPCAALDSFFVSFVDVQGTPTTNRLQLAQAGDTVNYTLNLLTSQILELKGPFASEGGEQLRRYLKAN